MVNIRRVALDRCATKRGGVSVQQEEEPRRLLCDSPLV